MLEQRIQSLLWAYLGKAVGRAAFSQYFADLYFAARNSREPKDIVANRICNAIVGPLSEFSLGHRDEESFRSSLLEIAKQFSFGYEILYSRPKAKIISTNKSFEATTSSRPSIPLVVEAA